jgi:hypothetical protein
MQFASWPKPAPKPDLGTKAEKKYDVEAFLKGIVKENETRQKRKNPPKNMSQQARISCETSFKTLKFNL